MFASSAEQSWMVARHASASLPSTVAATLIPPGTRRLAQKGSPRVDGEGGVQRRPAIPWYCTSAHGSAVLTVK
eukprot:2060575-Prymnesium_polylepis.1